MVESNDFAACGIGVLHKRLEFSLVYKRLMVKLLRGRVASILHRLAPVTSTHMRSVKPR